jgi:hypothetical protein
MILLPKLAALGSILLALISTYPGMLNDIAFFAILFFPIWIPAVLVGGWIVSLMHARYAKKVVEPGLLADDEISGETSAVPHRRWFIVAIAILILNFVLILNGIARQGMTR